MHKPIVLYVDDNRDDLDLAINASRMAETRFELRTAQGADRAIAYLTGRGEFGDRERFPLPVLLLLDLKMPRLSGFELLKWMRERKAMQALPVAVLTSSEFPEDLEQSLAGGANYFLSKPTEFKHLLALMTSLDECIREGVVDCAALQRLSESSAALRQ